VVPSRADRCAGGPPSSARRLPVLLFRRQRRAGGGELLDLYWRAALYVDRVLKGEKPGELPIQQATKFELVINLKTAKALGLDVPISPLARTDEAIE
jgi:putative ABC transport system substrate-binding protein